MLKQDFFFIRLNLIFILNHNFSGRYFTYEIACILIEGYIIIICYDTNLSLLYIVIAHLAAHIMYNEARWKALCLSKQKACAEVFIADELLSLLSSWLSVRQPSGKRNATKREECRFALFLSRPQDFSVSGRFTSTIGKKRKIKRYYKDGYSS